jgi:EmrB/QacA subfamily drug resistance transporter
MKQPSPRTVLIVLSLAAFMASLDLFIVNVAFDDIGRDLGRTSLANLSWVLNGYAIVYAAMLVPLGRLADRYGQKGGFLLGLALFTFASGACAASPGLWWLVAFRVLQAIGAALLTPTSMALLLHATPPPERARAVRIWAATGALAAAAGPVVGGLLVIASWRWVFLVNVPVGLVTLFAAMRSVPPAHTGRNEGIPDLVGAGWLAIAIAVFALALVKSDSWSAQRIITSVAVAAVITAAFVWRSRTHASPVIEPGLLRVPAFFWSNVTALAFSIGFAANLLANILWMQQVWHFSALKTGLAISPGPLMVPVFATIAQLVARRMPAGRIAAAGCVMIALGAITVLTTVDVTPAYATTMLPGWMIAGAGVGLAMPTILSCATVDLPASRAATGSAVVNMGRQVGSVLGVSLLVALLGRPEGYATLHAAFQRSWWAVAATSLAAAVAALGMTPRTRAISEPTQAVIVH